MANPNLSTGRWRVTTIALGLTAAVALVVTGRWLVAKRVSALPRATSELPAASASLRDKHIQGEIVALRRQVAQVRAAQAQATLSKVSASEDTRTPATQLVGAVPGDASAEEELAPELEEQRELDAIQARVRLMDETWTSEATDPEWASTASASLNEAYAQGLPGISARANCRWSLCRIELSFESALAMDNALMLLSQRKPWPGRGFFHIDTEKKSGVYYVGREDFEFPQARAPESG
jgi:hypothetical protein